MLDRTAELLPAAELEVLACLRNRGPLTARAVRESLQSYRPMTHGAVATLLKRLEEKGWVAKRKGPVGKAFLFEAAGEAEAPLRKSVSEMLRRLFNGNGVAFVASLFDTHPPTLAEVDQLQTMLARLQRKGKRKTP